MTARVRLAVTACGLATVIGLVGLAMNLAAPAHFEAGRVGEVLLLLNPPVFAGLGAFLIVRRPDHPAGYLLGVAAWGIALDSPAKAVLNLDLGGRTSTLASSAVTVENTAWLLAYWAVAMLVFLYPTGRLLSRRWRFLPVVTTAVCAVEFIIALAAPLDTDYPGVHGLIPDNPIAGLATRWVAVGFPLYGACLAIGVAALFVRGRRARAEHDVTTSAQIRWLAWALVVVIAMFLVEEIVHVASDRPLLRETTAVLTEIAPYLLVAAVVVAITRHGLFEIDKVVSRTVTYALVTAFLLAAYVGIIAGLSALLPTNVNSFVVAAATLAVAALFVPVRRTVQRRVDRRFNRTRHDRDVLVEKFADRLRRNVGSGDDDLLTVVHRALEPAHAGVWLVPR